MAIVLNRWPVAGQRERVSSPGRASRTGRVPGMLKKLACDDSSD